ncbi:hypothetical protein D4T97_005160 [Siminovitchia acidinfaciens]|uniref:Lipoprotein n=1 Tax=Siminovitchia acidinfaciens TaxID=2321395 RepID=A0A429Y422_9BACI|nr:hypothetical protein [Siminovitchia acidinfaciens]RST76173.1 hypothetical protein D4T97_005160 [Siminovitchia acidinfaciens]
MKKRLLFLVPFILLSVACNQKTISFSGESDYWKGEYSANISDKGTREDGKYIFGYKNATSDTSFDWVEIEINDGETGRKEENFKGATIIIPRSCSGCSVTREDTAIKVRIKWDGEMEESFVLEPM